MLKKHDHEQFKSQSLLYSSKQSLISGTTSLENLIIEKLISSTPNTVYLANDPLRGLNYLLHLFPFENEHISSLYLHLLPFYCLNHSSFLHTFDIKPEVYFQVEDRDGACSCVLQEFIPNGSLSTFASIHQFNIDDKLIRTLFRQLIDGLDHMHQKGLVHLNLSPSAIRFSDTYRLKILNAADITTNPKGTVNFRGQEMTNPLGMQKLLGIEAEMDVYSAGVLLFYMKAGKTPFDEENENEAQDFRGLFEVFNDYHWSVFKDFYKIESDMSVEMRRLIGQMCQKEAKDRCSFLDIKKSKFYNGEVYEQEQMSNIMKMMSLGKANRRKKRAWSKISSQSGDKTH